MSPLATPFICIVSAQVINALNSGANVYMADFEDSNCPTWTNLIEVCPPSLLAVIVTSRSIARVCMHRIQTLNHPYACFIQ